MKYFIYTAIIIVAAAIVGGFFIVGSPNEARLRRADEQRVMHLDDIQWRIVNYWQSKERLPESLENLTDEIAGYRAPVDPETKGAYEYRVVGPRTFELCATFNRPSSPEFDARYGGKPLLPESNPLYQNWAHGAGRTCFERGPIDPDIYLPFSKMR